MKTLEECKKRFNGVSEPPFKGFVDGNKGLYLFAVDSRGNIISEISIYSKFNESNVNHKLNLIDAACDKLKNELTVNYNK